MKYPDIRRGFSFTEARPIMKYKVVISDYSYEDPSREKAILEPIGAEVLLYDDRSDEERVEH